jgi:hypothetical protein
MSITRSECRVSELVRSDTCPRPTTHRLAVRPQDVAVHVVADLEQPDRALPRADGHVQPIRAHVDGGDRRVVVRLTAKTV